MGKGKGCLMLGIDIYPLIKGRVACTGFLYAVQLGDLTKIGFTGDPTTRFKALRNQYRAPIGDFRIWSTPHRASECENLVIKKLELDSLIGDEAFAVEPCWLFNQIRLIGERYRMDLTEFKELASAKAYECGRGPCHLVRIRSERNRKALNAKRRNNPESPKAR